MPKRINLQKNSLNVRGERIAPNSTGKILKNVSDVTNNLTQLSINFRIQKEKAREESYLTNARKQYKEGVTKASVDINNDNTIDWSDKTDALESFSNNLRDNLSSGSPFESTQGKVKNELNDLSAQDVSKAIIRNSNGQIKASLEDLTNNVTEMSNNLSSGDVSEEDYLLMRESVVQDLIRKIDAGIVSKEVSVSMDQKIQENLIDSYLTGLYIKEDYKGLEKQLATSGALEYLSPESRLKWENAVKRLKDGRRSKSLKIFRREMGSSINFDVNSYNPGKFNRYANGVIANSKDPQEVSVMKNMKIFYGKLGNGPESALLYLKNFKGKSSYESQQFRRLAQSALESYNRQLETDPKTLFGSTSKARVNGVESDLAELTVPEAEKIKLEVLSGKKSWHGLPDKIKASLVAHGAISVALNQAHSRGEDISSTLNQRQFYKTLYDHGSTEAKGPGDVKRMINKRISAFTSKFNSEHTDFLDSLKKYNGSELLRQAYGVYLRQFLKKNPSALGDLSSSSLKSAIDDKFNENFFYDKINQIIVPLGKNKISRDYLLFESNTDTPEHYIEVSHYLKRRNLQIDGGAHMQEIANSTEYKRQIGVNSSGELFVYLKKGNVVVPIKLKGHDKYMDLNEFLSINVNKK